MSRIRSISVVKNQTSDDTAGTRSVHAHGLTHPLIGGAETPDAVFVVPEATDDDTAFNAAQVAVVKWDHEEVTVKASAAEVPFTLVVVKFRSVTG